MPVDLIYSLFGSKRTKLVVLDENGAEHPLLVQKVLLSFRGVAESTRRLKNSEFILIDHMVYVVKWRKI